ncbi:hypothetical protein LTR99_000306 [Exophiala xenobiotica]|uniref:Uncharacterized protein n=1 Tax=Vermiconidia calcicola TaxID=1690605 RepID=A0AAV9QME0_9PEZI|nr:hypothetical protein LTR99_000306 [Exophiala xenobiotica]KAK5439339.1 hypothetical protein LTR34_000306 [Exophiala xenobiotica]KAK5543863.1 hypothetical protein LTR25_001478 [Vermiconidia calcicola]KAK5548541.1 hypothetical protein LTR23_001671 [Chaetothyriales sp. CCFEE 6169]
MTAARLSPAASLLRTSKLFALPPSLSLPLTEPSSEPVAFSDTATTPYPLRAALETPASSLNRGDWGLKRSLPVKTTTSSGTPTIRIQRGIDTPEHVADFESAADHVITLRKFQELNLRMTLPAPKDKKYNERTSAFSPEIDHTADTAPSTLDKKSLPSSWLAKSSAERVAELPKHLRDTLDEAARTKSADTASEAAAVPPPQSTQAPDVFARRRWRYSGPYLAGMNGMQVENFLKKITREKRADFRAHVKQHLINERLAERRAEALEQGQAETVNDTPMEVSEEELTQYLRQLRSEPGKFGPLIVEFFDLADGPNPSMMARDPWSYGRDTIAADQFKESGPPRTHPSAGLSYINSESFSQNDVVVGPRETRPPVPARLLKSVSTVHQRHIPYVGMAGFVIPQPLWGSTRDRNWQWKAVRDGPKTVVTPTSANISQAGKVEINTKLLPDWHLEDDVPVNIADKPRKQPATTRTPPSTRVLPLDRFASNRLPKTTRPAPAPSQDVSEELAMMGRAAFQSFANKST